jgi:hypothetical protein
MYRNHEGSYYVKREIINHSIRKRDNIRNRGGNGACQGADVNRTVLAAKVGPLGDRDGDARRLRKWSGGSQKRDNSNECGERETHLVKTS